AQLINKVLRHVENAESDQLVRIQPFQIARLHFLRIVQRHIEDGHGELLFIVNAGETETVHPRDVLRVSREVKDAGAFAIVEKTFGVDLARIARDDELDVLLAGLGKVDALKSLTGQSDWWFELLCLSR